VYGREFRKEERKVTAEEQEQFAAIGYLGGQIPESRWNLAKDPKDFIDEWTSSLQLTNLVDQRDYRTALELSRKIEAASVMPSASLLLLQSKCYAGLGDIPNAEKVLKPLSDTPEGLTALAQLYEDSDRIHQAEQLYTKALEKQFSYFTLFNYVLLLRESGQTEKAISLLEKIRNSKENTDHAQPFFAEMYIALQNWQPAAAILTNLVKNRPWEAKWYRDLSIVYQAQGKFQDAFDLLSTNRSRFPDDPEFQLRLGILFNKTGQKANELQLFQEFVHNWPEDSRGYFYLGKAMLDSNQDSAIVAELAQKGLAQNPDPEMSAFGYFVLGNAYERMGKNREAQKAFTTAEQLQKR
jgi:tetratricopeptide (TPR) repeat protein